VNITKPVINKDQEDSYWWTDLAGHCKMEQFDYQ